MVLHKKLPRIAEQISRILPTQHPRESTGRLGVFLDPGFRLMVRLLDIHPARQRPGENRTCSVFPQFASHVPEIKLMRFHMFLDGIGIRR